MKREVGREMDKEREVGREMEREREKGRESDRGGVGRRMTIQQEKEREKIYIQLTVSSTHSPEVIGEGKEVVHRFRLIVSLHVRSQIQTPEVEWNGDQ